MKFGPEFKIMSRCPYALPIRKREFKQMRFNRLTVIFILMVTAGPSTAEEYVVQFGALKQPYEAYAEKARQIGSVLKVPTTSGFTRYELGPYESGASAREAMGRLRSVGYRDAYVKGGGSQPTISTTRLAPTKAKPSKAVEARQAIPPLPDDVRSKLVYVDGVLHVKEGDRFTPLVEYQY